MPSNDVLSDRLLTVKQAATFLGYAEGSIRNMAGRGDLPVTRLGRSVRFRLSELERWIAEKNGKAA